jgi:excisionase family DNA binding protein
MAEEKLLTVEQIAENLQVSDQTVRRWIRAGELRAIKLGRAFRIRESDLQEFLNARMTVTTAPVRDTRIRPTGQPVRIDGRKLKALREDQGLTVRELASRAQLSESRLYTLQKGRARESWSTTTTLQDLAEALGVEPKELIKQ